MTSNAASLARAQEPAQRASVGTQVVLDLYECETEHLDDLAWVKATLVKAARAAGATSVAAYPAKRPLARTGAKRNTW